MIANLENPGISSGDESGYPELRQDQIWKIEYNHENLAPPHLVRTRLMH